MPRQMPLMPAPRAVVSSPLRWALIWCAGVCVMVVAGGVGHHLRDGVRPWHPERLAAATVAPEPAIEGRLVLTEGNWFEKFFNNAFGSGRRTRDDGWNSERSRGSGLTHTRPDFNQREKSLTDQTRKKASRKENSDDDDDDEQRQFRGKTYRTMCVRLCDGFYWPVSFSTTKDRFDDDAAVCARSCGGPDAAKLYVYRNPGADVEAMADVYGRAYTKLDKAFAFRAKYEPSCKCQAHPWEEASVERHKSYALAAMAQKGNVQAALQLKELRAKQLAEVREAKDRQLKEKTAQLEAEKTAKRSRRAEKSGRAGRIALAEPSATGPTNGPNYGPRQPRTPSSADAPGATRIVILHYGNRPPRPMTVPNSGRMSRAADAGPVTVIGQ